jgi:hypothetical protein
LTELFECGSMGIPQIRPTDDRPTEPGKQNTDYNLMILCCGFLPLLSVIADAADAPQNTPFPLSLSQEPGGGV